MFEINKTYQRRAIHAQYGGNAQGGISNCADHPIILIFTGTNGEKHGYEDGWDKDGYFHFTGEGQEGDMKFGRGNRALLNHIQEGKSVFLFQSEKREGGLWKFVSQLELVDFYYFDTPDRNQKIRNGIKFVFRKVGDARSEEFEEPRPSTNYNIPSVTEREGLVTSRVGQGFYRRSLLSKWKNKCAVTGMDLSEILIASHIVPWKDATSLERLDPNNGILLAPHIDALFDRHLISFEDDGKIMISKDLSQSQRNLLGLANSMRLREVTPGMKKYLQTHRKKFNESN